MNIHQDKAVLLILGAVILVATPLLSWYLWSSRFRFGNGLTAEYRPGRESQEEALRNFITAFSIFASIQLAVLTVGLQSPRAEGSLIFGISSLVAYLIGLILSITLILGSSLGGVSIPLEYFPALMAILGIGIGLTILLLSSILG